MGQYVSKVSENCSGVANLLKSSRKRKRYDNSESENSGNNCDELCSPKKKRLLTTTQYIYQTLFKDEKSSDIAVMALGRIWNLHKVYLCQSPYFNSMFNGSWKEASQNLIDIKIFDKRITLESLDAVFGSLYSDIIEIDPKLVVNILATATLFHLDGVIEKCAEVMIETIHDENAVIFYEAACDFGCLSVKKIAFQWLEINLLCVFNKNRKLLSKISIELMTDLIKSPDLYVLQTEFSIYTLLRTWIYIRLNPNSNLDELLAQETNQKAQQQTKSSDIADINDVMQKYFSQRSEELCPFLYTAEGQVYLKPFLALRTQYLTNHHMDLEIVLKDNIIPKEWLNNHVMNHWNFILAVDHQSIEGPGDVTTEEFEANCMRCGRILLEPGYQKWRWTGFNYGLDLILISDSRMLTIRRHHRNEHERLLSLQTKREFQISAAVSSINALRQPTFTQKTNLYKLCLERNEETIIMEMDPKLVHPLLISVNLLVTKPPKQNIKDCTRTCDDILSTTIPISEIGGDETNDCDKTLPTTNDCTNSTLRNDMTMTISYICDELRN